MFAVIQTGGKQYKVQPGDVVHLDFVAGELGKTAEFSEVLYVEGGAPIMGKPLVSGAKVTAEVLKVFRGPKITIVKHKRRKNYRRTLGHRQDRTRLLITEISDGKSSEKVSADQRKQALEQFARPAKKEASAEKTVKAAAPAKKSAAAKPAVKKTAVKKTAAKKKE